MWLHRPRRRNRPQQQETGHLLRQTLLILTLFLAVPVLVFSRGQQDDVLSRADELIAEKRYNEALSLLTPYMKRNPRNFDAAQERVHKILFIKEEYNRLARELLDEMEADEIDNEKILALGRTLMDLDPERGTETQEFIHRTTEVALFRSNMKRLDRVLTEGHELVDQERYTDALVKYTEGLPIYQEEFFSGPFPPAMQNRVREEITSININIPDVTSAANALQEAVDALEALSSQGIEPQNLAVYRNTYNRLATEMDRFTALRDNFTHSDSIFREDLAQLRKDFPQQGDRNFLAFAVRLMEGRGEQGGMLQVFDTIWDKAIPHARELLDQKSQTVFAAIASDAKNREYGRIDPRSEILDAYGSFPADLEVRWGRYSRNQSDTVIDQRVPVAEAGNYMKFRYLEDSAGLWQTLGQLGGRYLAVPVRDTVALWKVGGNGNELIGEEQNAVAMLRPIRTDALSLLAIIRERDIRYQNMESQYPNSGYLTYRNGINNAAEELINLINISEEDASFRRYTIANGMIQDRVRARENEFAEGNVLFLGTRRDEYLAKYPTRAADLLTRMDGSLDGDRQALQTLLEQYNAENPEVSGTPRIIALQEEAAAMLSRLDNTRTQGRAITATARTQSAEAETYRREGNRLFDEARAALTRNDFTTARTRVEQAASAYDQSLEREDDATTWAMRNTSISELDVAISEAFSAEVIRQVRVLLGQIQDSYYGNDFEQAERLISRAQTIWIQTQNTPNGELTYWSQMIVAGQRSGRYILPTAPLYAEMSQLLSNARRNYEEGVALILTSATERERTQKLTSAKQELEKVKLVYPMNEDAGILDLMIDRELDPNFIATLNARIQSFINTTKTGSAGLRIQAVNDLRNYRTVFRDFRSDWATIITEAEYDAGLRPRPPTPEAIEEARQIAIRARSIVAGNNLDAIIAIQSDLNRARQLDPNNREVTTLLDEAARKIRIIRTVLDPEAERLFQQASQALTQNNPVQARRLLQDIYARNPDYRFISKIITLQQRVDTRL